MEMFNTTDIPKSSRIPKLVEALYAHMPVIESARAKLITESYRPQRDSLRSPDVQKLLPTFSVISRSSSVTTN